MEKPNKEKPIYNKNFTIWDMSNAFYAGRAVGQDTDENTKFKDLSMKYDTFEKFIKDFNNYKQKK